MSKDSKSKVLLGEYHFERKSFPDLKQAFSRFSSVKFLSGNLHVKNQEVNRLLVELILKNEDRGFLLTEVLDYIEKIHSKKILETYDITLFELWLNQFSLIAEEKKMKVRSLIAGMYIPREEYQTFFPIGMGKVFPGSHFVTAHQSPDLDTIVASFWGWVDAFAAKISDGVHIWNVPGGPPLSNVEVKLLFYDLLGKNIFDVFSKARAQLSLRSFDLMTQRGFIKKRPYEKSLSLENERNQTGVVLVDDEGYYLGDWRPFDVESIRQVIMSLNNCLRWLESEIHTKIISLFSKESLSKKDIEKFLKDIFGYQLEKSEPAKEFTLRQQQLLDKYLKKVLKVPQGIRCSLNDIANRAHDQEIVEFEIFRQGFQTMIDTDLFDDKDQIAENRPLLFFHLEKIIKDLNEAFRVFRFYTDTLDIAYRVKTDVFEYHPSYLSHRSEINEIETKMADYPYMTVNLPGPEDKQIPVGIIPSSTLKNPYLGTATLRDFCNREETQVPSYLEVISVVDHHKSSLQTTSAPVAAIGDAQSANAICAQMAFKLHDNYSVSGMSKDSIQEQVDKVKESAKSASDFRVLRRLYHKLENLAKGNEYFVSADREYVEYLHYVYAILDDTDLLTKISKRDVESLKDLLNRLKTLQLKEEVEIIHFDDIEVDEHFVKKAALRLLQNEEMFSLYHKVYLAKEAAVEDNLELCSQKKHSNVFVDTKIQNGCVRVGQTKIFARNYPLFDKHQLALRDFWHHQVKTINKQKPELDLHLHMVSTIASAEELFENKAPDYLHKDQMWLWFADTELGIEHAKMFLSEFKNSKKMQTNDVHVKVFGSRAKEYADVFKESFLRVVPEIAEEDTKDSYAVIYYIAGSINSRKGLVSPYLPKLTQ